LAEDFSGIKPFYHPEAGGRHFSLHCQVNTNAKQSFVGKYPEQRYYFQPILDVLEYKPSNLEFVPDILMLEGKTDFYTFNYFNNQYYHFSDFHVLPGGGSGSLSGIIQLYLAWGRNFVIILDSDKEGRDSKKHYLDTFGSILNDRIFTLIDINNIWNNHAIEKLISDSDKNLIISSIFSENSDYSKKKLHLSIQELLIHNRKTNGISEDTLNNFKMIIEFLF
jgi:hypothetical protein